MDYQKLYFHLFNAITDALQAMDQQAYRRAAYLLRTAQQETEELFMCATEE